MQQQIKLPKLRRAGLRLVCLLAAVLAITQSASAWDNYCLTGDNYGDHVMSSSLQIANSSLSDGEGSIPTQSSSDVRTFKYTKQQQSTTPETGYTVYFDNSGSNWGSVYAYVYGECGNDFIGAWPGKQMESDASTGYYKLHIDTDKDLTTSNIIFTNNSSAQTADNVKIHHNGIYNYQGFTGYNTPFVSYAICGKKYGNWTAANGEKFIDNGDGTYTCTIDNFVSGEFKVAAIREDGPDVKYTWTNGSGEMDLKDGQWYTEPNPGSGGSLNFTAANGAKVEFTLTVDAYGNPLNLKATYEPTAAMIPVVFGKMNGNEWSENKNPQGRYENGWFVYNVTPTNREVSFRFRVASVFYHPESNYKFNECDDRQADAKSYTGSTENAFYIEGCDADNVTIKISKDYSKVNIWYNNNTTNFRIPVYPIGIYNDSQLAAYNEPTYYLKSMVLNNNQVTPEYQFVKAEGAEFTRLQKKYEGVRFLSDDSFNVDNSFSISSLQGKYVLELTMRNTTTQNENWTNSECNMWVAGYMTPYSSINDAVTARQAWNRLRNSNKGWRALAIFDASAKTLSIKLIENGELPFISMLGAEWKQNTAANNNRPYQTPHVNRKDSKTHNTDEGWQEAWIQYNDKGDIAKDRNGKVMYNTMWPPRNNVDFKTIVTLNRGTSDQTDLDFTISTGQLTFKPQDNGVSKSGSAWKSDERFKHFNAVDLEDISTWTNVSSRDNDYGKNNFALDNGREYVLYKIDNMWINGRAKMWTGWAGIYSWDNTMGGTEVANWSFHSNWGHFKELDRNADATVINPEASVQLSNREGDITFTDPTFFKSVYFFYDVNDPDKRGRCVLFTELAVGGAEIAALNNSDYTHGYFRPGLSDISSMLEGQVKSVRIDCYKSDDSEYMATVWNDSYSNISNPDFYTIFEGEEGIGEAEHDRATKSKAKWVLDANDYPNGSYHYKMTVVITDNNGNEQEIDVVSNPFRIYRTSILPKAEMYQLVHMEKETYGSDKPYYVTFRGDANGNPTLPAYKVKWSGEDSGNAPVMEELTEIPDYGDGALYTFTDKVLYRVYPDNPENTPIADVTIKFNGVENSLNTNIVGTSDPDNIETTSIESLGVLTCDLGEKSYSISMDYSVAMDFQFSPEMGELDYTRIEQPTTYGNVKFALTVPTPKFVSGKIEAIKSGDNETISDLTFRNVAFPAGARYHNVREVAEIEDPNATDALKVKMSGVSFAYTINDADAEINNGRIEGKTTHPSVFTANDYKGSVKMEASTNVPVYNRWSNGEIKGIEITDKEPSVPNVTLENEKRIFDPESKNHLIETFDLVITTTHDNNYIREKGTESTEFTLHHGTSNDYFYVEVYDKRNGQMLKDAEGKDCKYIFDAATGSKTISFKKDHGTWWDGIDAAMAGNWLQQNWEVRVSHLYPFNPESGSKKGMQKAAADYDTENVLKSQAAIKVSDIATSVEGIEGVAEGSVKAGVGFIEVAGNGVEIYSADGIKVAAGEGRHDLDAGVYVVRVSGRTQKVIVR